jgi:NAD(P)H dehydrogenase (quinone)
MKKESLMYAITGITGQVGGTVARTLLAQGLPVRAVVRDAAKGRAWSERGCDVAVAAMDDADALARAFADTAGVFVLPPPNFDPEPGFPRRAPRSPLCARRSMRRGRRAWCACRPWARRPRSPTC